VQAQALARMPAQAREAEKMAESVATKVATEVAMEVATKVATEVATMVLSEYYRPRVALFPLFFRSSLYRQQQALKEYSNDLAVWQSIPWGEGGGPHCRIPMVGGRIRRSDSRGGGHTGGSDFRGRGATLEDRISGGGGHTRGLALTLLSRGSCKDSYAWVNTRF
jgi:hypothetical protein